MDVCRRHFRSDVSRRHIHYGVLVYAKLTFVSDFYKNGVSKFPNHPTNFFHPLRFFQYSLVRR